MMMALKAEVFGWILPVSSNHDHLVIILIQYCIEQFIDGDTGNCDTCITESII